MTDDRKETLSRKRGKGVMARKKRWFGWVRNFAIVGTASLMAFSAARAETSLHRLERKTGKVLKRTARAAAKTTVVVAEGVGVVGGLIAIGMLEGMLSPDEDAPSSSCECPHPAPPAQAASRSTPPARPTPTAQLSSSSGASGTKKPTR